MIIPINWLSDYLDLPEDEQKIADSFTSLGLMQEKSIKNHVLELEHRMDRADWLSLIGCARDLAAFSGVKLITPKLTSNSPKPVPANDKIALSVETPTVRRFNTRVIKGIKVGPSPDWLLKKLEAYGIDSINNIVDITNFVMVEYGQPMHAQDLATLPEKELVLRETGVGEKITTFLGTEIKLPEGTFVISSGNVLCVIGGIVGGNVTGVTNSTTDIFLDAGNYDQRVIRRTSRTLKIQNETVLRYDKFLDPRLTENALTRATDLILELAGGAAYDNADYYPDPVTPHTQILTLSRLKLLSGLDLTLTTAKKTLSDLGYVVVDESDTHLELEIPHWRTDIEVEDDLIADILRIGDYSNIPNSPLTTPVPPDITPDIYLFEDLLRDHMTALTAHEHITSPLVKSDDNKSRVNLANALSSEQNALRLTLHETLNPVLTTYTKHNLDSPLIFEIAKSFTKDSDQATEIRELTVCSTGDVRNILTSLMKLLNISYSLTPSSNYQVSIIAAGNSIGTLARDHFTLNTELLFAHHHPYAGITTTLTHSPSIDLSLTLPPNLPFSDIQEVFYKTSPSLQSTKVLEHYEEKNSILVRLTWEKLDSADQTRISLVKALKGIGVETRSA